MRTFKTPRGLKNHAKKSGLMSQCRRNEEVKVKASKIKLAQARKIKAKTVRPSKVDLSGWDGAFKQGTTYCQKLKTALLNILQVSLDTQCGKLSILLSLRFYVKSILENVKVKKCHLVHAYQRSENAKK